MSTPWNPDATPEEKAKDFDSLAEEMDAKGPSDKSWEECFPPESNNNTQGKW